MRNCNDLSLKEKEPILLTHDHLAHLILEDCHKRILQSGTRAPLIQLRTQFWEPREKNFTQKILRHLKTCCRGDSKSYRYPYQPALPSYRINSTSTSLLSEMTDYTGHLFVKSNAAKQSKAYIAVFVHLERVTDLTTEQFLLAFRRTCAGKSVAKTFVSDKAIYFTAGESAIKTTPQENQQSRRFWEKTPYNNTSANTK